LPTLALLQALDDLRLDSAMILLCEKRRDSQASLGLFFEKVEIWLIRKAAIAFSSGRFLVAAL
jgi:hypothetical protein